MVDAESLYPTAHSATAGGSKDLPVVVVGAGPVGLAAAAHLLTRGMRPAVFESGPAVGDSIRQWGHVRLFSPWKYLVDDVAAELLAASGWQRPDGDALPTGAELVEFYLEPLGQALAPYLSFGSEVVALARAGRDKLADAGREVAPFDIQVRGRSGGTIRVRASAVIDASGTYRRPNPLGANGLQAAGERTHVDRVRYGVPDATGAERDRYDGKRVAVVGAGHTALNALLALDSLRQKSSSTRVDWVVRGPARGRLFGGGDEDELTERGRLGSRAAELVQSGAVKVHTDFRTTELRGSAGGVVLVGERNREIGPFDEIVAATGYRPDLDLTREIRVALDPAVEAPVALAPLIDPNIHSCGTVPPHGAAELAHPETGYFCVGMKSYGRAPTFLLLTGYEQVRSVVAHLDGDLEAAARVELELPETGLCVTDPEPVEATPAVTDREPVEAGSAGSCCAPTCCSSPENNGRVGARAL